MRVRQMRVRLWALRVRLWALCVLNAFLLALRMTGSQEQKGLGIHGCSAAC
jgi:hypothetical protein